MSHGPFHQEERIVTTRPFVDTLGALYRYPRATAAGVAGARITEVLFSFGGNRWWGLPTTVRNWPPVATKTKIGGTKNPDIATILALRPELVFAVAEENRRQDVEQLATAGVPVYVFAPHTVRH